MNCLGEGQSFSIEKRELVFVGSVGSHGAWNNQNQPSFRITRPLSYPTISFIMIHIVLNGFNYKDCDCGLSWRGKSDANNKKQERDGRNLCFSPDCSTHLKHSQHLMAWKVVKEEAAI
jgi:hypothetical protein